ncbi:MAG: ribosome maturation factor RimP [Gemmatimonadales bacterium]
MTLEQLTDEIRRRVSQLGFELVDLRKRGAGARIGLQLRIDRPDAEPGRGITVDQCAEVSRVLERWLDTEQVLGPRYVLEVSSPGIERPIRWREHWERFRGKEVNVRVEERGRFRATIVAMQEDADVVILAPVGESDPVEVPLDRIREATLVVDWEAVERQRAERRSQ